MDKETFPEGGVDAWLTVLGGCIMVFCCFGSIQSFGVFEDDYARVHLAHNTPSEISWIGSVQTFLLFLSGPIVGKLFDKGYARHTLIAGSLLYIFSSFMLSLAQKGSYYQHFLSQGVGMGLAMGLMFLPAITIPSHYFRVKRAVTMGIVMAGGSIGAVVKPVILNTLFKRSFAWAIRAVALMELVLLVLAIFLIRPRLKVDPNAKRASFASIAKDFPFMLFLVGSALGFWGLYVPYFYVQLFATFHQVPPHVARYSVAIMNAASVFGRTTPNLVAQSWGNMNVIIPCTFLTGSLVWSLLGARSVGGVVGFALAYGFFSGGLITMCVPAGASYAHSVSEIGTRSGMQALFFAFAVLTGSPIAGALLDPPRYLWWRPLTFASVVILVGGGMMVVARDGLARRRGTWRV